VLAHAEVTAGGAIPDRAILFLHGILGSGGNWRTFARRFVEAHPTWAAILVDLRLHGGSREAVAPHTLHSAARDLGALERSLAIPVRAVLGHSFGGKVALTWLAQRRTDGQEDLDVAVVVDSTPSARPDHRGSEDTVCVLSVLATLTAAYPDRDAFVADLGARGIGRAEAQWLAMSLDRVAEGLRFGLDVAAIRGMLDDYFARDLWHLVEEPRAKRLEVVVGERSSVVSEEDRRRLHALAVADGSRVGLTLLGAGHLVHVDDPVGLLRVVADAVVESSRAAPPVR
jgi:esterase